MNVQLIVHGGAGLAAGNHHSAVMAACRAAVAAGLARLREGDSALNAVEIAVRALEDDPLFNAGYGSVLNRDGQVQMDALIMDGRTFQIGAVAAVSRIKNPISLARRVMEATPHHLLVAEGAERFAAEQGIPLVSPEAMIAPRHVKQTSSDTVGAVALDSAGNLAVAVSTGGVRGKLAGRVGDSPLPGAGGWADNALGAACATGLGEGIIRALLTFRAVSLLETHSAQAAADAALAIFGQKFNGEGGLIVLDRHGQVGIAHNTPYMPVAWLRGDDIVAQVQQP
ncbi:MAG: isoaspartyl peptidase/L-asparaginase family protein [Anaerolineae bacterium]|nr:isoaspartyl peptidase/L-asparaginase family protein [Anaerolineae bacterium]MDW8299386.1 isoaspartyl peptidase/L-asparaginase family protein [Anaerolineae bacterium]